MEKEKSHLDRIKELEERLIIEKEKLAKKEIELLERLLESLNRNLPNIKEKINKLYYECYKTQEVEEEQADGVVVYVIGAKNFNSYINNAYGRVETAPSITTQVNLNIISVLDPVWIREFGSAYE